MSAGQSCRCEERNKPIKERRWIVYKRHFNNSAFNGRRKTYSDYSSVSCKACRSVWRTKAKYVALLPDGRITDER